MKIYLLLITFLICFSSNAQTADVRSMEWFRDAKFGLFIHWGLYSQVEGEWKGEPTKGGEHFMLYHKIPLKEYSKIAESFNPTEFDASSWAKEAKNAGMKYVIITAKHHEGFAMFDSKCSDYNIVKRTPYARDPMKELVEACRKEGLKFGFYYSLGRDWEDPNVPTNWPVKAGRSNTWDYPDEDAKCLTTYIENKVKPQIRELLTNYGKIDFLWFDTAEMVTKEHSSSIRKLILDLQPHCLINNRIGNSMGDYKIVEQTLMDKIDLSPWESCLTMGKNWGYSKFDTLYKAPDILVRHLVDIVSKGGNLLLNVGPNKKGQFSELTKPIMAYFHDWMKINSEAIYGTRPWHTFGEKLYENTPDEKVDNNFHDAEYDGTPQERIPDFRFTTKDNNVYVIVRHIKEKEFLIKSFSKESKKINDISCLGENLKVSWKQTSNGLKVSLDKHVKQFPVYVLKVTYNK